MSGGASRAAAGDDTGQGTGTGNLGQGSGTAAQAAPDLPVAVEAADDAVAALRMVGERLLAVRRPR